MKPVEKTVSRYKLGVDLNIWKTAMCTIRLYVPLVLQFYDSETQNQVQSPTSWETQFCWSLKNRFSDLLTLAHWSTPLLSLFHTFVWMSERVREWDMKNQYSAWRILSGESVNRKALKTADVGRMHKMKREMFSQFFLFLFGQFSSSSCWCCCNGRRLNNIAFNFWLRVDSDLTPFSH